MRTAAPKKVSVLVEIMSASFVNTGAARDSKATVATYRSSIAAESAAHASHL
jgi:hypothetical protein